MERLSRIAYIGTYKVVMVVEAKNTKDLILKNNEFLKKIAVYIG